ncbi:hypothetical protein GJ744_000181 [Endocarpon pusillum]|uniref:Uncharacterized protein n=1 Tax=Endocarpon pusillum TaxID=364733 RepID=A0A8H7AWE5_9EURO|nr:hypothetical protein GJ744_000181 [Endocarpon pusillum]
MVFVVPTLVNAGTPPTTARSLINAKSLLVDVTATWVPQAQHLWLHVSYLVADSAVSSHASRIRQHASRVLATAQSRLRIVLLSKDLMLKAAQSLETFADWNSLSARHAIVMATDRVKASTSSTR